MSGTTRLAYRHIDDYLGPGETRFFSHGYRRATYDVREIRIVPVPIEGAHITAAVSVAYPTDWSRKKTGVDLRPHLSTIDMLVLGVEFADMYLTHAYGLDGTARACAWLRRVTLTAGMKPQEELEDMPASACLRETVSRPDGRSASTFDCQVGAMRARYEIEHATGPRNNRAAHYAAAHDLLGPAAGRYYGDGFKSGRHTVEDVDVDIAALVAEATATVVPSAEGVTKGIDGAYQPSVSVIDCFVVNLQLAQTLMYELDSVNRANSNTLWMLRTVLEAERADRPCHSPLRARMEMTGKHLLPLRGGHWRNAEFAGCLGGVGMRCSFAHELPTTTRSN